jgi:hypothetical protein
MLVPALVDMAQIEEEEIERLFGGMVGGDAGDVSVALFGIGVLPEVGHVEATGFAQVP